MSSIDDLIIPNTEFNGRYLLPKFAYNNVGLVRAASDDDGRAYLGPGYSYLTLNFG